MTKYKVEFEKKAAKVLKKLDKPQANLILSWIKKNLVDCEDPRRYGKALVENHKGKWRYRIGDYRLIANISDTTVTILILDIGHRKEIYD